MPVPATGRVRRNVVADGTAAAGQLKGSKPSSTSANARSRFRVARHRALAIAALPVLLLTPRVVFADAGVPMIFLTWPAMAAALVPIIAIESIVLKYLLPSTWREATIVGSLANIVSTLVGIPLAWIVFLAFEFLVDIPASYLHVNPGPILGTILFAAWLGPNENDLDWMVPLSTMVLLVGFLYVSVWLESSMAQRILQGHTEDRIRSAVWRANLASYALLEVIAAGFLVHAILQHARS